MHPPLDQRTMPHEVELPQLVRSGGNEAAIGLRAGGVRTEASRAAQDAGDGAGRRGMGDVVLEAPRPQLAPTPARMLVAERHEPLG
jgi:hypothetical protein